MEYLEKFLQGNNQSDAENDFEGIPLDNDGNHGDRDDNHGNRDYHGNGGDNRGNKEINWRTENRGHGNPQMSDLFRRPRDDTEDRRNQAGGRSFQGNLRSRGNRGENQINWRTENRGDRPRDYSTDRRSQANQRSNQGNFRGRGRGGRLHTRNVTGPCGMGIQRLEEMTTFEPDKLVLSLSNENEELEKLFSHDMSCDHIVMILRVMTRLCESTFNQNKATVLATICDEQFMSKLNLYLTDMILHDLEDKKKNKYFWEEQERFWNDLLTVYENILKIIPNRACDVLPKLVKKTCLSVVDMEREQHSTIPTEIKVRLEKLEQELSRCVEQRKKQANKLQNNEEPPDDFREISLFPTVYEITNNHERVFLRKNIVEGKYDSVDHYLDVQFRLLREDFVAPLRDGICNFLDQTKSRDHERIYNVHIYKDVRFLKKQRIQGKIVFVIQLPSKKIKLENSKRFMFGSLVCFTNDNFKTIVFGTVASRETVLIARGQIAVDVLEKVNINVPYIMVECGVFFEPYYHVLKALQIMTEDKFPLKRYIIDVETDVHPPAYYNMLSKIMYQRYVFYPFITKSWPSSNQLGLDESQFRAFQAALTHEFSIIKGPPGTGKTYIGLKVVQALLENCEHWNGDRYFIDSLSLFVDKSEYWDRNRRPILVICFTNHALDQFLEGILQFTTKLVRIGGQSKSLKLAGHNIREMRYKDIESRYSATLLKQRRESLEYIIYDIQSYITLLDAVTDCKGIINFKNFIEVDERITDSWFMKAKPNELVHWLLTGRNIDERYAERRRDRLAQLQARIESEENKNGNSDSDDDDFFDAKAENERMVDDDEFLFHSVLIDTNTFILKLFDIFRAIAKLDKEIYELDKKYNETNKIRIFHEREMKVEELEKMTEVLDYLTYRLDEFKTNHQPPKPRHVDYANPFSLAANERWGLYFHWLQLYRMQLIDMLNELDEEYRAQYQRYEEVRLMDDTQVMKQMMVVGMTTSGAARYQSVLQALKCPIVIVEEAAEVLESHVVVSLTKHCQHLILIGDHQQLRPTTAEYRLAKKYNLEISLFERMVNNNIHCVQLEVQHRMRPEIARLIVPAIYPKLENHSTVETYPPVKGITKNVFFITHTEPEEEMSESGSKRNVHEAKFLIRLARHLILQGYEPSEITILATYSGQMTCLCKERQLMTEHNLLKDVLITVVDNFQGEENKIILLSLVRSNEMDNVGFLKIENRVCVALSRAREGMFIMGNINILEKSSAVWRQIKTVLESNDELDTHLTLQCQVHPDQLTRVAKAEDFDNVNAGGCSKLCNQELDCGHVCPSLCHTDSQHAVYKCQEKCLKILCEKDHPCPDLCSEECQPCMVPIPVTLECEHIHNLPCHMEDTSKYKCNTHVEVVLEDCDHRAQKPCHQDIKTFACRLPCEFKFSTCGHRCPRMCHIRDDPDHLEAKCTKLCERINKNCSEEKHKCFLTCYEECQPCDIMIHKIRSCGHMHEVKCSVDVEKEDCNKRCNKTLDCGHKCKQKCCDPCGNCKEKVTKTIPECNHEVRIKCSETTDRSKCNRKCPRILSCGHRCDKRCSEMCQPKCAYLVDNTRTAACGHQFQVPCYKTRLDLEPSQYTLLKHCTAPCEALLPCSHRCSGTCGTCAQGRVHVSCQQQCGRELVCGHVCTLPCQDICQPCTKRCSFRCKHSKCGQKCGEVCKPCRELCPRRCPHIRCFKRCGEICDVDPCTEPCPIPLKCGHPCIGFCGDPCPPVCRVCDADDETFVILFGNEDDPNARFVYLEECKHVIEAEAMDKWMKQADEGENKAIYVQPCPKCKTTVTVTQRFSHLIKEMYANINLVMEKWFEEEQQSAESRFQLQLKIELTKNTNRKLYLQSTLLRTRLQDLQNILKEKPKGKRNPLNIIPIISTKIELDLIAYLVNVFTKGKLDDKEEQYITSVEYLDNILYLMHIKNKHIYKQRASDIKREINRFERFIQLCTIQKHPNFQEGITNPEIKTIYDNIVTDLNSLKIYSDNTDKSSKPSLEKLAEAVDNSLTITDEKREATSENKEGLEKGRWFKCPKGHIFAIGEATDVGKCNECDSQIKQPN